MIKTYGAKEEEQTVSPQPPPSPPPTVIREREIIKEVHACIGITIAFANPLAVSGTFFCTGRIAYSNETSESILEPIENNSETYVDSRGYVPMIVGVGLLSVAILDGKFKKHKKALHACTSTRYASPTSIYRVYLIISWPVMNELYPIRFFHCRHFLHTRNSIFKDRYMLRIFNHEWRTRLEYANRRRLKRSSLQANYEISLDVLLFSQVSQR